MRIVYNGHFLFEGLKRLGHEVLRINPSGNEPLNELIEAAGGAPDMVILELFGDTPLPRGLSDCPHPLAAYCVDAPLNEFWLIHLARVFDFIFVDQPHAVESFRKRGIEAQWLPLFAYRTDLRPATPKEHLITFVGRTSAFRTKRNNLLKTIAQRHPIHVVQGVNRGQMQDLFARSQIVLNENLFPGLTLRMFQGLASGGLLLTEEGPTSVAPHFQPGLHLETYRPDNLLQVIDRLAADPGLCAEIGRHGRELCEGHHLSEHRAQTLIDATCTGRPLCRPLSQARRRFHEATANYHKIRRFGGQYQESVETWGELAAQVEDGWLACMAKQMIGDFLARKGEYAQARNHFAATAGLTRDETLAAALKTVMTRLRDSDTDQILGAIITLKTQHPERIDPHWPGYRAELKKLGLQTAALHLLARVLIDADRIIDQGFRKQEDAPLPETALEYALLAWQGRPGAETLDLILLCLDEAGLAPEALPFLRQAILCGIAKDGHMRRAARLAEDYYDHDLARAIMRGLNTVS